ncbi:MAG TPA: PAS domain-containing protein [Desulfomonilaceae bacterium]|nr:PAS domain-containing protein [Desulfomonilaceae bacterium]
MQSDTQVIAYEQKSVHGSEPALLQRSELTTLSIDIDSLLPRELTDSGSHDLRWIRNISFGKLLESIPIPTILVDASHNILFFNKALLKMEDELRQKIGSPFSSLFAGPTDKAEALAALGKVLHERGTLVFECSLSLNGKTLWCRIHLRSVRFKTERMVLALVEDLTAEKKQLIINEKYQQLVQVFPIGIAEFALGRPIPVKTPAQEVLTSMADAKLVGGNREFAKIHGHRAIDRLKGYRLNELLPFGGNFEKLYRLWAINRFPIRSFEIKEPSSSGKRRYFEITLVGNVKNGYLVGLWTMRQDITQRKEVEAALRAARDKLEERVRTRTDALMKANERLKLEIDERKKTEQKLEELVNELQDALKKVKTLSGLLPICASCKKIRDDRGYWTQVEVYVRDHTEADFTHSICPDCAKRLYPDLYSAAGYEADR